MSTERSGVRCRYPADEVLGFLATGAGLGLKARSAPGASGTVILSTGPSAWSWGEKVEVSVVPQEAGCEVLFRGAPVLSINLTASPRKAVDRVIQSLNQRFGPLELVS